MATQMILAGNYEQADHAAKAQGLAKCDWRYVADELDICSARQGSTIWLHGTYYTRKDYDDLAELCAKRDIGLVVV